MAILLYMDVHIPRAIIVELRRRGIDVITAQEDGTTTLADPALLDKATALQRTLFTFDSDLLIEATRRQQSGEFFGGVIYGRAATISIGSCVDDLEVIAKAGDQRDLDNWVQFLPL